MGHWQFTFLVHVFYRKPNLREFAELAYKGGIYVVHGSRDPMTSRSSRVKEELRESADKLFGKGSARESVAG